VFQAVILLECNLHKKWLMIANPQPPVEVRFVPERHQIQDTNSTAEQALNAQGLHARIATFGKSNVISRSVACHHVVDAETRICLATNISVDEE
jgi:hypothetical protein